MNRREQFKSAANHENGAPLIVDFGKHIGSPHKRMYPALREALGLPTKEYSIIDHMAQNCRIDEDVLQALDVDVRWLTPDLTAGARMEGDTFYDMWGVKFKNDGVHYAMCENPLEDVDDVKEIVNDKYYPDPNNPDLFKGLEEEAKRLYETTDYILGADGMKQGLLQCALQMRGYETFMCDLLTDEELVNAFLDKILEVQMNMWTKYLEKVGKYVQIAFITDDYGTQVSMLISPDTYLKYIHPRNKKLIDHIKSLADVKVMLHCDGSILPILNDIIDSGVDILNPMQTTLECLKDTKAMKETYGDRLMFHGGIDVQRLLPMSDIDTICSETRRIVGDLWNKKGGYIIAPCHNIEENIEPKKIIAMYETIKEIRNAQ